MQLRTLIGVPALSLGILVGVGSVEGHASTITFDTRFSAAGPLASGADYRNTIEGLTATPATAGYCSATPTAWDNLSNQLTCGGTSSNIAYEVTATFTVSSSQEGTWSFRNGVDYGRGGALFLDSTLLEFQSSDMWWALSYIDPAQHLSGSINLLAGTYTLRSFGLEPCCDGPQQAQFLAPGSTVWTTFSNTDGLDAITAPEPATTLLMGGALLGVSLRRRRP